MRLPSCAALSLARPLGFFSLRDSCSLVCSLLCAVSFIVPSCVRSFALLFAIIACPCVSSRVLVCLVALSSTGSDGSCSVRAQMTMKMMTMTTPILTWTPFWKRSRLRTMAV